ncbi:MAG: hypothetical protein V3W50_01825 [Thermoanaerobaculia bacterium]
MRPVGPLTAALSALLLVLLAPPTLLAESEFLRGMIISCPRAGQIWGTSTMAETLEEVRTLGVRWVAIHPYARVLRDGTIRSRPAASVDYLQRATEMTREAGVGLFWKPHLAYWGSFEWRGDIEFGSDPDRWQRFFDGYRRFIVDQARFAEAAGVELFAVGIEYEKTTQHEREWRQIISTVREVYRGKITYAANWDSLDKVPFWDAVDLIGVHAYFPLAETTDPDRAAIWRGWDGYLDQLQELAAHHQKPILFAEIGYNRSHQAARRPWAHEIQDSPVSRALRQRLLEVALERIEETAFVSGMFWWKWMPGEAPYDRDFSMKDPEARAALQGSWAQRGEPTSTSGQ